MSPDPAMPTGDETDTNTPAPDTEEGDLSTGYSFTITVSPQGFSIGEPEPMAPEPQGDEAEPQGDEAEPPAKTDQLSTPTELVRGILALLKSHPMEGDAQAQFKSGFEGA